MSIRILLADDHKMIRHGLKQSIEQNQDMEAHRLRIMQKLDIDNVAQLTKYAIQEGLTPPEP
jgi:DNA-binding NarL/FixJ family response regulator